MSIQTIKRRSAAKTPLFEIDWTEDYEHRFNPPMLTAYMHEQVPVLEFVDWRVVEVRPGDVETVLPLNPNSTNQHFTHQAALIVLSADYSGGTALATMFRGWPVVGIHPVKSSKSVSMWLLKAEMKYIQPSTSNLTVRARIDESRHERIQKRFLQGKPVIETIEMRFMNGNEVVAEGSCTYFARQSPALRTNGITNGKVNSLYALKLTSSAEMIAGVRARESGKLFVDDFAEAMAGEHGMAVATRFSERSPQLGPMVAARTKHLDEIMTKYFIDGGRHVVNLGVGWDMRPFRLNPPAGTTFYELDFPTTLDEREKRLAQLGFDDLPGVSRVALPIDLRAMSLHDVLSGKLPEGEKLLIVWEGMSMYLEESDVIRVLSDVKKCLENPNSLFWFDLVDREPVVNPGAFPQSIQDFMRGMEILGEPFVFGSDTPSELLERAGLHCKSIVTSDVYFADTADPLYSIYQFCVATGSKSAVDRNGMKRTDGSHSVLPVANPHLNFANENSTQQ